MYASKSLKAKLINHPLEFKFKAGTSRGVLTEKPSWFIVIYDENGNKGIGEASIIPDLSPEWNDEYPKFLRQVVSNINKYVNDIKQLNAYPSVKFAIECALEALKYPNTGEVFPGPFLSDERGIPINGLIWMGDKRFMKTQIEEKLEAGFNCIKMKIGAIDFATELELLHYVRENYSKDQIILRVDANGAFTENDVFEKLGRLSELDLHSIEQPVKQGQFELMAKIAKESPLDIALDEELIGVHETTQKIDILERIDPQYIILKPSLMDGISGTKEWIELAEERNIGWWMTSALESNIGLNAIAQLCDSYNPAHPQGLGTGSLFTKNVKSPLEVKEGQLFYRRNHKWGSIE